MNFSEINSLITTAHSHQQEHLKKTQEILGTIADIDAVVQQLALQHPTHTTIQQYCISTGRALVDIRERIEKLCTSHSLEKNPVVEMEHLRTQFNAFWNNTTAVIKDAQWPLVELGLQSSSKDRMAEYSDYLENIQKLSSFINEQLVQVDVIYRRTAAYRDRIYAEVMQLHEKVS